MVRSTPVRMRAYQSPRDLDRFPREDGALGEAIFGLLRSALDKGLPRPAMFVFFADQVDRFELAPLMHQTRGARDRMLGAIAGQRDVECVALLGVLQIKRPREGIHVRGAVVFVEWPDNRWWTAWLPLDGAGKPARAEAEVRSAVEGFPRPGGVGGWFSLARRTGLRLHMAAKEGTLH